LESPDYISLAFCSCYILACLLSAVIFLVLLYRLAKWIISLARSVIRGFGASPQQQLVSLGLSCLVFPAVIVGIVQSIIRSLVDLATTVPSEMFNGWNLARGMLRQNQIDAVLSSLAYALAQSWTKGFTLALRDLESVPAVDVLLMIALGSALGLVLKMASRDSVTLDATSQTRSNGRLQDIAFFGILGIATYLSIGAVAAISVLQNPTKVTEDIGATRLKELLENDRQSSESAFEKLSVASPFSDLEKALASESDPSIRNLEGSVSGWSITRDEILKVREDFVSGLRKKRDDNISLAVISYQVENIDRKGGRESGQYFLDLKNWYNRTLGTMAREISDYTDAVNSMEVFWKQISSPLLESLNEKNADETPEARAKRITGGFVSGIQSSSNGITVLLSQIKIPSHQEDPMPQRRTLGSDLGIFSWLASWILRTESLPLALIVGMIGFGLLGSASSTFIRERADQKSGQPLVRDLTGVIIRGLSAAILVFLAVEGGLAVFGVASSGPSPEPNPFVIFLTCLVAAVFSETVWNAASERLCDALRQRAERHERQAQGIAANPIDGGKSMGAQKEPVKSKSPLELADELRIGWWFVDGVVLDRPEDLSSLGTSQDDVPPNSLISKTYRQIAPTAAAGSAYVSGRSLLHRNPRLPGRIVRHVYLGSLNFAGKGPCPRH
jgi:hypothetical protein